ncbi:hypothetical protein [Adhaeribacter pallidiroseus]|uniref:Uncharacterized protein n=1 Tax=Adhaeribacter pallidiroseus TaxID=2072847 RepID=A0A369QBN4_9BACT|nr:hypothetical protein [Adhaeribacter pallidiroseus]RDC62311.1 hypothetical protein AHMF7616_00904 [Adhaeribacter pallidiroseus]
MFVDSVSWKGGRLLFSIHNNNDFDLPLLIDLMIISLNLDYEIQSAGAQPIQLSGTQRTKLKDVFINLNHKETLLTEEQYTIPPNAQIPFKVNYMTTLKSLNDLVTERMRNAGHKPVPGSQVLIKKINYNLEIKFLNPQKNTPEALKVNFVKDEIKNLKFSLKP